MKTISLNLLGLLVSWFAISSAEAQWVRWDPASGGNGHWYKAFVNSNNLSWTQAAQLAAANGGYLATISSAAENNFVFSLVNSPEFFQGSAGNGSGPALGGYQPEGSEEPAGGWRWLTGETLVYTNWSEGSPNNGGNENRLHFFSGAQGVPAATWNDLPADDTNLGGYVFEQSQRPPLTPSGFYGQSFSGRVPSSSLPGTPARSVVYVYDSRGRMFFKTVSNPAGQFFSYLKPAEYTVIATRFTPDVPPQNLSNYDPQQHPGAVLVHMTVKPHQLTSVAIDF